MKRIAIVAGLAALAGLAFAEPRPPACGPNTKGVMWNFGSEVRPDIRRCDGVSYVPFQMPCTGEPAPAAAPAATAPPADKQQCESQCEVEQRKCNDDCHGIVTDSACIERCSRGKVHCVARCG